MNVRRFPARLLPALVAVALATPVRVMAESTVIQSVDFSDYTPGPGTLVNNPAVGEPGFSGFIFPFYPASGGAGDPLTGVVAESPLGTGAAAYMGGAGTNLALPDTDTYFEQTVFSGSFAEAPVNLIDSSKSVRKVALDFLIERHAGTNQQGFMFAVYDALDADNDATWAYHSYVRIRPDNTVAIADNSVDLAADNYSYIQTNVTLTPGVAYRLEITVDYDLARWSATIAARDGSASYVVASSRAINSANYTLSGWTTPGTLDITEFGVVSASDAGLLDRMYFDNLTFAEESDSRFWHEQTVDDYSAYTPGRTILDGKGHIYMPWTIYANGADMNAGQFVGQLVRLNEADGRRDPTFNLDTRIKRVAYALPAPAPDDDKMLLSVDIGNSSTVVRVDGTGAIDPTFTATLFAYSIRFMTVQPDGKIVVAATDLGDIHASVSSVNPGSQAIYRLNADGTLDSGFTPAVFTGGGTLFGPPVVDASGRIYLAGAFYDINGVSRSGIARLSSTGVLDQAFADPAGLPAGFHTNQARAVGIQSTGDVVVIGDFYYDARGTFNNRIMAVRFKDDGSFDASFSQPLRSDLGFAVNGYRSRALVMQEDKLLIVSDRLVRLNADGTVDSSFTSPTFGGEAYWLAVESDGTIYVPGLYTVTTPTGDVDLSAGGVGRFLADGSLDPSFVVGGWGISEYPTSANLLSDGSAVVGGYFNRFGTMAVPGLGFFDADGTFAADRMQAALEAAGKANQTFAQTTASVAPAGADRTYVLLSGLESPSLFRLDASGLTDESFQPAIPETFGLAYADLHASGSGALYLSVTSLDVQNLVNGGASTGTFIRVNADGSLDSSFHPAVTSTGTVIRDQNNDIAEVDLGQVQVLHVDEQDRAYVAAAQLDGTLEVARLTATGALDATFAPPDLGAAAQASGYTDYIFDPVKNYSTQAYETIYYSDSVRAVQPMWNGSVYIAGNLALPNRPRGLVRVTASGAIDSSFTGEGLTERTSDDLSASFISALAVDNYRRLYFAGLFDRFDGTALLGIGRLRADGTLDADWQPGVNIVDYPQAAVTLKVQNDQLYVFGTVRRDGEAYPTGNPQVVPLDVPETAPTIGALADVTVALNTASTPQPFTVDDNETPAGELQVTAASSNQDLVPDGSILIGFGTGEGGGGALGAAVVGGVSAGGGTRTVRVIPAQNQTGSATITLTVSDGTMEATSSFKVTIDAPPTISQIPDVTTKEDTATAALAFTVGDDVTAAGQLAVTRASSNPTLVPTANVVLGGSGANRTVKITPAANQNGSATITLTVTDGLKQTTTSSFKVTVTAVNDAPTISTVANQTVAMGGTTATLAVKLADIDTATTSLKLTATSTNTAVVPASSITLGGSGANRTVKVQTAAGKSGSSMITLGVNDGTSTVTSTFTVTVNVPPTIGTVANQTVSEDQSTATLAFKVADPDTSTSQLVVTGKSSNTALVPTTNLTLGGSGANRTVKIKPAANANGTATITLTVSDGYQAASSTFLLTVKAVNDAPTITAVPNQVVPKSGATGVLKFSVADKETTASKLKVTATSSNPAVVATSGLALGGSGANRTIKVTPLSGKTGSSTITLTVSDGALSAKTTFVVKADNRPTITSIAAQTIKEDATSAAIAFKVSDVETTAGKLVVTATSSNSSLVAASGITLAGTTTNRTIKLKPVANANGSATITVTVSDGGLTASSAFKLTVTAVNDAPVIGKVANQTVAKNGTSKALAFTVGDLETAASNLTVTRASSNTTLLPTAGIVLGGSGANRTVTLKPAANKTGTATVTLTVSDGSLKTNSTFTVTVK